MTKDWSALDHAEGSTHHIKATSAAPSSAPSTPATANLPKGNSSTPEGIAAALAKRTAENNTRAAYNAVFVLPGVLPMTFPIPASWGPPLYDWPLIKHGFPCRVRAYENGNRIVTMAHPVSGRD